MPKTNTDNVVRVPIMRSPMRDSFILAQALYEGAKALTSRADERWNEPSNAHDMGLMLDAMFPGYRELFESQAIWREAVMLGWPSDRYTTDFEALKAFIAEKRA